ncbi:unnamed protein product [Cuscuta campestris]|uniref:KIB1-4 beta-propeller domain-containing protein n=1 Tax=Cuscuta campestris TaxID=132261 RepID=A0A484LJS3_9ASTE|nr:unnamed protein product [Cuscuta campestris]
MWDTFASVQGCEIEKCNGEVAAASQPAACRPWLVHYHGKGYRKQPFASDIAGPSPGIIIPGLGRNKVLSCAHGCLVLYDYKAKLLSLCNSATFDNDNRIRLPHLNHLSNYKIDSCVLLPPPLPPQGPGGGGGGHTNNNSSNWHGFTVSIFLEKLPSIMFCRVGETKWREIRYGKYLEPFVPEKIQRYAREWGRPLFFKRAVGFDGKIYAQLGAEWIGGFCYSMMSIEIVEVEVQVEVEGGAEYGLVLCTVEEPAGLSCASISPYTNVYIVESCGELFLLHFSPGAQVFELWKYFDVFSPSPPISMNPQHVLSIKEEDKQNNQKCNINNQRRRRTIVTSELESCKNTNVCIQLYDLPFDLLEHISKHLIATEYMNFRAASKICQSLCPPINWRIALSETEKSHCFPSPLLMFPDSHESVYKFVDPSLNVNGNNYYLMSIPDSLRSHHIIRYSEQGWVLLSKSRSCVNLYNPFKKCVITYNHTLTKREDCLFFIRNPPGSIQPVRVVFCGTKVFVSTVVDLDDPDEEWSWDEMKGNKNFDAAAQTSPVLFKDTFYYLDKTGKLGNLEIDFEGGNMRWEVLEKPHRPAGLKFFDHNFLVECGGELISIFLGRAGKWVSVYRLNSDSQVWEKASRLGGYDLYLNPTASSSSSAMPPSSTGGGGNRIYFPLLRGSDIVYFSMETGKWHFSGSQLDSSSTNLYGTRWYPNSCWIKPCW